MLYRILYTFTCRATTSLLMCLIEVAVLAAVLGVETSFLDVSDTRLMPEAPDTLDVTLRS